MDVDPRLPAVEHYRGIPYIDFLKILAMTLKPSSYLEIGTNEGGSLAQIECDAVCIDPEFVIPRSPLAKRRRSLFYQMTSDEFFAEEDVRAIFPRGVDLAFLDGMHWFEFLLRDLINIERCCHRQSLVLMHDCLPLNTRMAERNRLPAPPSEVGTQGWWTGDVWRILPILNKHRPDLDVRLIDCPPTGLVALSNLDPGSTVLSDNYLSILREFAELQLQDVGVGALWSMFPMVSSRDVSPPHILTSVFTIR